MAKKKLPLWKFVTAACTCAIISGALIAGTIVADNYQYILDVFFTTSDYKAGESEKKMCEEISHEGITLLKNDSDLLPLKNEKKIAFLGQSSVDFVYGGAGCGSVDASSAPDMKASFERAGFEVNKTAWNFYKEGPGKGYRKEVPSAQGAGSFMVNEVPSSKYTDELKKSLESDEAIVCVIGRSGGESFDLPTTLNDSKYTKTGGDYLYLQADNNERDMIKLACSKSEKVILVVNSNNAMELGFLEEADFKNVKSVLWVPGVGQEGLYALGDIVRGNTNPSGRLVDTWSYDSKSSPAMMNLGNYSLKGASFPSGIESEYNRCNSYIAYAEGIYVGYRYYETRYEDYVLNQGNPGEYDYGSAVQFPFGYGLSYSKFDWTDFGMKENDEDFEFTVKVSNNSEVSGKDVVEIYMQSPYTSYDKTNNVEKPSVELVGMAKTKKIDAGESETVKVVVDKEVLRHYDSKNAKTYIVDAGTHYFTAARDAHNAVNNIIAKKATMDTSIETGKMVGAGDSHLVNDDFSPSEIDKDTYAKSRVNSEYSITNQFDKADPNYYEASSLTYLSRNDWSGTMPTAPYKNGEWNINQQLNDDLHWIRSEEVVGDGQGSMPINGASTTLTIKDAEGKNYDDPIWDSLVNQVSQKKMLELVRCGGYQTIALKAIDLPSTIDKDGPAGISGTLVGGTSCMAWPVEVMMAATWNQELIEEMGKFIGNDSIGSNVAGWYAPGADIHRTPYSGRNFEYYSEDGFLSGKIGAAEVRGVRARGVIPYMKHFALNDQETGRTSGAVFANEQSIREVFLKGFEYIVTDADCNAAMASMNRIGAVWSGAHKGLMTETLRNEWGFEGMVITDQASVSAMFYEDIISGLAAGTDMWLNTSAAYWDLDKYFAGATTNPTIMSNVHKAAKNIIYTVCNSNAVKKYNNEAGAEIQSSSKKFPWKETLLGIDIAVWVASAAIIGITGFLYFKGKKEGKEESLN